MAISSLLVTPGIQLGPNDPITTTAFNLAAKPTVTVTLNDPINDNNYFRNGNFYGAYWTTPSGVSCPAGIQTTNAQYWFCQPNGTGAINYLQSTLTPDLLSLYSAKLVGATGVADVLFGQQINGDLSATLRRVDAVSGWIYNGTTSSFTPTLQVAIANSFNNFASVTVATELNLQSCAPGIWTYVSFNQDFSIYSNVANGLQLSYHIPSGVLNASGNFVQFSRLKHQTGSINTAFSDDISLFVSIPTVGTSSIQNNAVTTTKIAPQAVTIAQLDTVTVTPFLCPTGVVLPFASATLPSGWLFCQGQAISRTTYSTLFAAIGTAYGVGDGVTTFNVPNLTQRIPMGFQDGNGNAVLGNSGGELTHILSTTEMPSHAHTLTSATTGVTTAQALTGITVNDPGHTHTYSNPVGSTLNIQAGATQIFYPGGSTNTGSNTTGITLTDPKHIHTMVDPGHNHPIANTGGGAAHNNLQPYVVTNYIIKT